MSSIFSLLPELFEKLQRIARTYCFYSAILILVQLLRVWIVKGRAWLEMDGIISGCRLVSGDRDRENAVCLT